MTGVKVSTRIGYMFLPSYIQGSNYERSDTVVTDFSSDGDETRLYAHNPTKCLSYYFLPSFTSGTCSIL